MAAETTKTRPHEAPGSNGDWRATATGGRLRYAHRKEREDGHREPRQVLLPQLHRLSGVALALDLGIHLLLERGELQHPCVLAQLPVGERRRQRRELRVPQKRKCHVGADLGTDQPLEPRVDGLAHRDKAIAAASLERRTPRMSG